MNSPISTSAAAHVLPELTDPRASTEGDWLDRLSDRVFARHLNHPDDVIFTRTATRIAVFLLPFTAALFVLPTWAVWLAGPLYLAYLFVGFAARIVLALHAVAHRPVFKRKVRWADRLWTHALPVVVGMPPFAYHAHHRMMHHRENVSESDLSGTAEYRRDSLLHFVHYWARFAVVGYAHLVSWLWRRGERKVALGIIAWSLVGYSGMAVLAWLAPWPTLFAFILPYVLLRFFLMAGNWCEHAFVDVTEPTNSYRNSVCLLNTRFNHRAYNAGYHLVHHIVPGLHWAAHPAWLEDHVQDLIDADSIVFDGISSNQQVWWRLMSGDYRYLAERLVDLGGRRPSLEARIAFLKSRVRPQRGAIKGLLEFREAGPGVPSGPAFERMAAEQAG